MRDIVVDGSPLSVGDVIAVARGEATARLGEGAAARMESSRAVVAAATGGDQPVYGVNTGFG
ncbi:MAG: aromatic amino acid lyase, partial [Nocardiopsaceae bacterium]|nr:aromatic amino acid lyase [Nocardiopsaceae bacterium]